ncbi:MAG: recombinase family protein [Lachnospiraceae bacterium]|nr:recombinase family protein [Lachnospiraceae bacterium]
MRWVSYTRMMSYKINAENPPDAIHIQNERIQEYMKANGWTVEKKYCDRKNSPDATEAFNQMVQDGVNRRFDGIVFDTVFRFGRSFGFFTEVIQQTFYPANIHFAIVEDDFCSLDKSREEVEAFFEKKHSDFIGENSKGFLQQTFDDGRYGTSQARYGYIYSEDRKELLVDEEAAETVRHIFQLYAEGLPFSKIARELDELGIERPDLHRAKLAGRDVDMSEEKKWSPSVIKFILRWSVYTGEGICKMGGKDIKMTAPAIVSRELYDEVQKRLANTLSQRREGCRKKSFLLTKKIRDKDTGKFLVCRSSPYAVGERVYMARTYGDLTMKEGKRNYIPQDDVLAEIKRFLHHEKAMAAYVLKKLGTDEKETFEKASLEDNYLQAQEVFARLQNLCSERMERHLTYDAGQMGEEAYQIAEQEYKAACQDCEDRFQSIMQEAGEIRKGFSRSNKWVKLFLDIKIPEELESQHLSKWIEMVEIVEFERIEITPRMHEWKQMLPEEWINAELEEE